MLARTPRLYVLTWFRGRRASIRLEDLQDDAAGVLLQAAVSPYDLS